METETGPSLEAGVEKPFPYRSPVTNSLAVTQVTAAAPSWRLMCRGLRAP